MLNRKREIACIFEISGRNVCMSKRNDKVGLMFTSCILENIVVISTKTITPVKKFYMEITKPPFLYK